MPKNGFTFLFGGWVPEQLIQFIESQDEEK